MPDCRAGIIFQLPSGTSTSKVSCPEPNSPFPPKATASSLRRPAELEPPSSPPCLPHLLTNCSWPYSMTALTSIQPSLPSASTTHRPTGPSGPMLTVVSSLLSPILVHFSLRSLCHMPINQCLPSDRTPLSVTC